MDAVLLVACILKLISVTLNSLGIYFLHKVPSLMSNQQLLLMNLSLTEILLALSAFLWRIMTMCGIQTDSFYSVIVTGLSWYFYFVYLFAPFIIMLDGFIGVVSFET